MPQASRAGNYVQGTIVKAKTAAYTCTVAESGVFFTNRGATVAVNFTLPLNSSTPIGTEYTFYGISAYGFTVTSNPADTITTLNDAAADTITCTTTSKIIGAAVRVIWDGTSWLAFQASVGNTYAVAT